MIAILWSAKERKDFLNTIEYIALSSPQNASLVGDRIEEAVSSLQRLPTGKKRTSVRNL
jgi:plasmid stabilization system protein ParE